MSDYQDGCSWAELVGDANQVGECQIHSIADFWNESQALFQTQVSYDFQVPSVMSASVYPTGQRVDHSRVIGNPKRDTTTGQLISAQSFLVEFDLPWSYETQQFELEALDALSQLQQEWENESDNPFRIEVAAYRSYEDEFLRSIITDLPLLPGVFAVMSAFCCLAFWRRHKVHSKCLLGVGAVVCVVLSIMTSFGVLFLFGVPFTTSTTMLPFLMFGMYKLRRVCH
jgi:Niemann-Pick C1 protein